MGYGSQAGQVLFRTQASPDTFPADFEASHVAMKLRSGALAPNRDLLVTDPEIGGSRDVSDAYLGGVSFSGDYDFYARMESITTLLKAGFGSAASAAVSGVNTHTITPSDSSLLPFLGIEEKISSGMEIFNYTDAVVNTLHLEAEANGFLMGTAGLIARKQLAGATATATPSWDNSPLTVGTNITVTLGGVQLPAKSFSWDFNNNFEDDDFRLGSFFIGDLTPKSREVNGSISIRPSDSALWRRAVYGAAGASAPGGTTTKDQLVITATTYEDIDGSAPLTKSSLSLTMPKVVLEPFGLEPSGDDVIENDISFRAIRPLAATPICTAVVKSGKATIA